MNAESVTNKFTVGERQRQRKGKEGPKLAEVCCIDPFLTHVMIPYIGPYVFTSLTRGSKPGSALGHCPSSGAAQGGSGLTW